MPPCRGTRHSSVVRPRGHVRLPEGQGARTQKCPAVAQSCRVSGRRPRVSETCDRSRRESITVYTAYSLRQRPPKRDRQSDRVRGSGFGVAQGRRSRTASRGRSWTGGSCRNVAYLQRNAAGKGTTSPPGKVSRGGISRYNYPTPRDARADETARTPTRVSAVSRRS